jgi:hypothetical protein
MLQSISKKSLTDVTDAVCTVPCLAGSRANVCLDVEAVVWKTQAFNALTSRVGTGAV